MYTYTCVYMCPYYIYIHADQCLFIFIYYSLHVHKIYFYLHTYTFIYILQEHVIIIFVCKVPEDSTKQEKESYL